MEPEEQDSYFDLSFGKCSQTARRNEREKEDEPNKENIILIQTSQNNRVTPVKSNSPNPIDYNYSHYSYSNYLIGRVERESTSQTEHAASPASQGLKEGCSHEGKVMKKPLIYNIDSLSAKDLPHPRDLRKRRNTGTPKCKKAKPSYDNSMMVENHIKQMKFYCARVARNENTSFDASRRGQLYIDDIELPPLPEIKTQTYDFKNSVHSNSFKTPEINFGNITPYYTPEYRLGDISTTVIDVCNPKPPEISDHHPYPDYQDPYFRYQQPAPDFQIPDEYDKDAEWFSQQWKARNIIPPYKEE